MAQFLTMDDFDFKNKTTLVRVDFNSPLDAEKNLTDSLTYSEEYQAYEGLGYIAGKKNDLGSAEKYYLRALEINPRADEAVLNLGGYSRAIVTVDAKAVTVP